MRIPCPVPGFPRLKLLKYAVKVNRAPLVAMLDSGATVNTVDARTVARIGGAITPQPEVIRLADGTLTQASGTTKLYMTGKGFSAWVPCLVVRRLNVDVVLGRP